MEEIIMYIQECLEKDEGELSLWDASLTDELFSSVLDTFKDRRDEFAKIKKIGLHCKNLTTLPDFLENCANLEDITIGNDENFNRLPNWLRNCKTLTSLNFTETALEKLPEWIGDLVNLTSLRLKGTKIDALPESMQNLAALSYLDLPDTCLLEIPEWIGKFHELKTLNLSRGTEISLLINAGRFMSNWENKKADKPFITRLPDSLADLVNLVSLNLSGTSISEVPEWIGNFTHLNSLYLCGTKIRSLPESIGNLINLQILGLDHSQIEVLPESFGNLKKIAILSLKKTNIRSLPDSIGGCTALYKLCLNETDVKTIPSSICNMQDLGELYLYGTNLTAMPGSVAANKKVRIFYQYADIAICEDTPMDYDCFVRTYHALMAHIFTYAFDAWVEGVWTFRDEDFTDYLKPRLDARDIFDYGVMLLSPPQIDDEEVVNMADAILSRIVSRETDKYRRSLKEIQKEAVLLMFKDWGWKNEPADLMVQLNSHIPSGMIKNNEMDVLCGKYAETKDRGIFTAYFNTHCAMEPCLKHKPGSKTKSTVEKRRYYDFCKKAFRFSQIRESYRFEKNEAWYMKSPELKEIHDSSKKENDILEYGLCLALDGKTKDEIADELSTMIAKRTKPMEKNFANAARELVLLLLETRYIPEEMILATANSFFDIPNDKIMAALADRLIDCRFDLNAAIMDQELC